MNNIFNAVASTFLVAAIAIFAGMPSLSPPAAPTAPAAVSAPVAAPAAAMSATSAVDNTLMTEMLSALSAINRKLDTQPPAAVSDGTSHRFDPAGSDGVNPTPTWPTPSNTPPPRNTPTAPTNRLGSGSTGSGPAGYRVIQSNSPMFSDSSTVVTYSDGYSSTGGYSRPMASTSVLTSQAPGLFGRIRARNAAPARPIRSSGGTVCIDGVCYPAN